MRVHNCPKVWRSAVCIARSSTRTSMPTVQILCPRGRWETVTLGPNDTLAKVWRETSESGEAWLKLY